MLCAPYVPDHFLTRISGTPPPHARVGGRSLGGAYEVLWPLQPPFCRRSSPGLSQKPGGTAF